MESVFVCKQDMPHREYIVTFVMSRLAGST
jgi:hypothetical protein